MEDELPEMTRSDHSGRGEDDGPREPSYEGSSEALPSRAFVPCSHKMSSLGPRKTYNEAPGIGQAASFRTSIRTAIVNRKSAMLLHSQAKANKLQNLCCFLPTIVLRKLSEMSKEDAAAMKPDRKDFHECAVVMLDMCGFTHLAEGLRHGKLLLNNDAGHPADGGTVVGRTGQPGARDAVDHGAERTGLAKTYSRTMMSAKLLRLQTTEEAQAGFGAEQLKVLLNAFFKLLMSTITDHGGDILRLAGDALIVAFVGEHGELGAVDPDLLRRAAMVSALCLKRLDGMRIQGHVMHLHVALGVGTLELYTVGGAKEGWQYVAAGAPFSDLATAMDDGTAGQMVLSRNYWNGMTLGDGSDTSKTLENSADGGEGSNLSLAGFNWRSWDLDSGNIRVDATAEESEIAAVLKAGPAGASFEQRTRNIESMLMRKQDYLERVIRRFIPAPILYVCEAEQSGWFAEIGRVAVIFVNIDIKGLPGLDDMQNVFLVLQRAMKANQGVIKEFSVDDKGTVMVGALGLPPITGSNPAARACVTALKIVRGIQGLGITCYVGVSFGPVFTASIGGQRREFMLVGDVVNTAARLMSAGKKLRSEALASTKGSPPPGGRTGNGGIVVDSVTARLASGTVEFHKLGTIHVKGKSKAVEVYTPLKCSASSHSDGFELAMIGHVDLRATLQEKASSLVQGFGGGLLVLQGEPGVGKTCLINECGREWQREGVTTLGLTRQQYRRAHQMPFAAWRGVMQSILLLFSSAVLGVTSNEEISTEAASLRIAHDGTARPPPKVDVVSGGQNATAHAAHAKGGSPRPATHDTQADSRSGDISTGDVNTAHSMNNVASLESDDADWSANQATAVVDQSAIGAAGLLAAPVSAAASEVEKVTVDADSSSALRGQSCDVMDAFKPLQTSSVGEMAEHLRNEVGVLQSMHSMPGTPPESVTARGPEAELDQSAAAEGNEAATDDDGRMMTNAFALGAQQHQLHPFDTEKEQGEEPGVPAGDGNESRHPAAARLDEKGESSAVCPSWAGAFGAVPEMEDDPQARGFYAKRFCEVFFPDNIVGATEVLCALLDGAAPPASLTPTQTPPDPSTVNDETRKAEDCDGSGELIGSRKETSHNPADVEAREETNPNRDENREPKVSTPFDEEQARNTAGAPSQPDSTSSLGVGMEAELGLQSDAASTTGQLSAIVDNQSRGTALTEKSDGNTSAKEREAPGLLSLPTERSSYSSIDRPEKSRFEVLLGMLTLATMVDAGGAAVVTTAQEVKDRGIGKSSSEMVETTPQAVSEEVQMTEAAEDDGSGHKNDVEPNQKPEAQVTGLGVVAVLDNAQEMDRCSCDLVKASTKYLHERLLVVLVSPPLPATVKGSTNARRSTSDSRADDVRDNAESGGERSVSDSDSSNDDSQTSIFAAVVPSITKAGEADKNNDTDIIPASLENNSDIPHAIPNTPVGAASARIGHDDGSDVVSPEQAKGLANSDPANVDSTMHIQTHPDAGAGYGTGKLDEEAERKTPDTFGPSNRGTLVPNVTVTADNEPYIAATECEIKASEDNVDEHLSRDRNNDRHDASGSPQLSGTDLSTTDVLERSGSANRSTLTNDMRGAGVHGDDETNRSEESGLFARKALKTGSGKRRSGAKGSGRASGGGEVGGSGSRRGMGSLDGTEKVHHLQIGAAAFMEAGNALVGAGYLNDGTPMETRARRDSGFIRYWNTGTTKLLEILISLQGKTSVETVRVGRLRYHETVQLGCRHLGCDELDPIVGLTLYLRTHGIPLYVIAYCNLMLERKLGENVAILVEHPISSAAGRHSTNSSETMSPRPNKASGDADAILFPSEGKNAPSPGERTALLSTEGTSVLMLGDVGDSPPLAGTGKPYTGDTSMSLSIRDSPAAATKENHSNTETEESPERFEHEGLKEPGPTSSFSPGDSDCPHSHVSKGSEREDTEMTRDDHPLASRMKRTSWTKIDGGASNALMVTARDEKSKMLDDVVVVRSGPTEAEAEAEEHDRKNMFKPKENIVFRFQESVNVFKMMEATVPAGVESRIIEFLSCLSAQQIFVLRVMSVIGIGGIESDLLEAVYPIPVRGNPLREDLEALQACRLIKVERCSHSGCPSRSDHGVPATPYDAEPALSGDGRDPPVSGGCARAGDVADRDKWVDSSSDQREPVKTGTPTRTKAGRLVLSFRDLVVHQVVYTKVSHTHRRQLHESIAEWIAERQRQSPPARPSDNTCGGSVWEDNGDPTSEERKRVAAKISNRRGSFESGKAVAKGRAGTTPSDCIPRLVHHLTLAHQEQKAMIRAHLFGTRELERWAMGAFAAMLETRAASVPDDLLLLARKCKPLMWMCPSLIGILKTLLAIRSGAGVSNATSKFRSTIVSSRERSSFEETPSGQREAFPEETQEDLEGLEALSDGKIDAECGIDRPEDVAMPAEFKSPNSPRMMSPSGGSKWNQSLRRSGPSSDPETIATSSPRADTGRMFGFSPQRTRSTRETGGNVSCSSLPFHDGQPKSFASEPARDGKKRRGLSGKYKQRQQERRWKRSRRRSHHHARPVASTPPACTRLIYTPPAAAIATLSRMARPRTAENTRSGMSIFVTTSSLVPARRVGSARTHSGIGTRNSADFSHPATADDTTTSIGVVEASRRRGESCRRRGDNVAVDCFEGPRSLESTLRVSSNSSDCVDRSVASSPLKTRASDVQRLNAKNDRSGVLSLSPSRSGLTGRPAGALKCFEGPSPSRERAAAKLDSLYRVYGEGVHNLPSTRRGSLRPVRPVVESSLPKEGFLVPK